LSHQPTRLPNGPWPVTYCVPPRYEPERTVITRDQVLAVVAAAPDVPAMLAVFGAQALSDGRVRHATRLASRHGLLVSDRANGCKWRRP
jgi:hypothetical protein